MNTSLPFPPLALRRQVSPVVDDSYYDNPTGDYILGPLDLGPLAPGQAYERVLDFGCGPGRDARRLLLQRKRPKSYVGVDINRPMIQWCQENLSLDGFSFVHHDIWSPGYGPENSKNRYLPLAPLGSGFTLIRGNSMFTHLHEDQTEFYLRELCSMLAPTGIIHATWFFFNKKWFPMMEDHQNTIFVNEHDTTQAVYYDWSYFRNLTKSLGLHITGVQWTKVLGFHNIVILTKSDQFPEIGDEIQPPSSVIGFSRLGSSFSLPQYKQEITSSSAAASDVRVQQMATDLLAEQSFQADRIASLTAERDYWTQQHAAMRSGSEQSIRVLSARLEEGATERERLTRELDDLRKSYAETTSKLSDERQRLAEGLATLRKRHEQIVQELQRRNAVLDQIQNSRGWKALSLYYRLRNKLIPERMIRIVKEGVSLLRDMRLVSASGLFDKDWYLRRNPDVAQAGVSPLRHYLRRGALEGRDPNMLFDSDWYLTQYPDVAKAGVNPLVHYLRHGANEGRDPSPDFDTDWYLQQYQDVAKAGVNPLVHYVLFGTREGRSPRPGFDGNSYVPQSKGEVHADLRRPAFRLRPIACPAQPAPLKRSAIGRRLICVTHVLPYPPRAGNEYRIHRMLDWLADSGFEVFLVLCPVPSCVVTPELLIRTCSVYSNLILCERDGTLSYHLADGDGPVKGLDRVRPRYFGKLLGKEDDTPPISPRLLTILSNFCPDLLVDLLLHLDSVLKPDVILTEYIFMTRPLPLMRRESLKVIDTIDVFSTKHDKVCQFGIEDSLALNADEEASLLARADLVIAIQPEEAAELDRLVPDKPIVTVGVDFDPINTGGASVPAPIVLVVGSDNALNVRGLRDFLRFAWPLVRREVPDAELRVVGAVGLQVEVDDPSVRIMGQVDDLTASYAEARVVINPAVAGTGLKIKTIEALSNLRPLVTWPSGVDGVDADVRALCYIATDWYMFARQVIDLCKSEDASQVLISKRNEILQRFSPDTIYSALKAALSSMHAGAS